MKKFLSKRVLSFLLALMMIVGMLPASAITVFAAEKAEIVTDLPEVHITQGRMIDDGAIFICGIEYNLDGAIYKVNIYPPDNEALKAKYPVGMDVTSWFVGGLPEGISARISRYRNYAPEYFGVSGDIRPYIQIGLSGVPTETTAGRAVTITVPGDFYQDGNPVTFHSTIIIDPLGSACGGCTFKTINGMQVCYKEGKGIHVCETNFGDEMNTIGDEYDKNPEDGYISAEEEPSRMTDADSYWYFFDIEEVDTDTNTSGFFYLNRFANLRTVNIGFAYVVFLGENNTKLESINVNCRTVTGLDKVPSSAPLQKIEIKNATVDRYDYNFPMLEKLVLTDSVIDGEADDQIFITKDCAALKHIDLSGTDISHNGSDTNISYDLANLEYLDISKTGIENVNIAYYSKLKYFYAANNGLDKIIGARGEHDKTLADKCPELVEVDISDNYYISQFDLGEHQNIRKLNISNNDFVNLSLNNLPSLKELYAGYNDDLQALYLMNNPALEKLNLCCTGTEDFAIAMDDSGLPGLKYLDISYSDIVVNTNTAAFWAKMPSLETLDISYADSVYVNFSDSSLPNLKELIADGYNYDQFYVGALPKLEKIVSNESYAKTVSIYTPNLKELEITDSKVVTFNFGKLAKLQELVIENNKDLTGLDLEGFKALEWIEAYGCDSLAGIDFTDCWSIRGVRVSRDVNTVWPSGEGMPYEFDGWYTVKDNDDYTRNYHDGLKANREEPADADLYMTLTYNIPNWKTGTDKWGKMTFGDLAIGGEKFNIEWPHKIIYNLSPYKETTVKQYTFYAAEVLSGDNKAINMPGVVGWATKKFATESEIAYRPGEMIYNTGEDLELWPVYNTETIVYYSAGNYSEDIGWNIEADEVDGLEEWRSYEYKHTFYGKSSLSDYWTFEILDLTPTREGYIFKGWQYSTANGVNIYQPGDEIEVVGDKSVSLSAKWEKQVEMPSAYTYLSCDKDYFEKGDTVTLTAKVVGMNGADVSETRFNAFLYLYEEGKESEKTKVAERVFTGDEVDLTFTYPVDDTRIAYVEIFAYTGGDYSQKSITDDYTLVPANEMDVEFKYSVGDGYVTVTEDTTIVLPQGANDGELDIEVDALGGKGDLNIRLYEINSNVTVGTDVDNVVSTNTIGTKNYRASVSDETGNIIFTDKLTVTIVPLLEILSESEDSFKIARNQEVVFSVDYKGYVGYDGEFLDELYIKEWDDDANAYIEVPGAEIVVNAKNTTSGTISFVIPVSAPASGDYEHHRYYVYIKDRFGNDYEHDVEVEFDRTAPLTFAVDGRGTIKFYDYYNGADYAGVFANGTDVAAELDGGWVYDITDKLYDSKRAQYPDNVLVPTLGTDVSVEVKLYRYESYEAYKADRYTYENAYESKFSAAEFDSSYYVDITNAYASNEGRIPGTVNYLGAMAPGYYTMTLYISNRNGLDLTGTNSFVAEGGFEVLATGAEHVHDYKVKTGVGDPHIHTYECICGDSYTENHVFPANYPVDGQWRENGVSVWNDEGTATIYKPTNAEYLICSTCGDTVYRWRFLESFTIDNADLQEGKTDAYEKTMAVDQTISLVAKLDFLEELNPELAGTTAYKNLSEKLDDFWPVNTKINWTSSNQDVAKVDENGVVTTVGEGTALITGTTVQPNKETGEPMTVTILINVNCKHAAHKVKVPAQEPTCQADGHIEHYMCLDCTKYSLTGDFTDTVSYENDIKLAKVDHAKLYGVWHSDANGHWRECKYGCGTRYDEGTHYSTEAANCQHPEYCAVCDYVLAPITAHSHDKYGWSEGYHWSICECGLVVEGSNEVHQFGADGSSDTCDDCGYKKNVGYTVSGTITSFLKDTGDITVQLLNGDEIAYSQVFNTYTEVNASRKEYSTVYSIPAVVDGTYTLRISKANHVTRDYTVTVNGGVLTQDAKIHLLGDVTGDGKINALDKKKIYNHINGDLLTGYEFDVANVKADTKINALDKKMIYNHINGESLWK